MRVSRLYYAKNNYLSICLIDRVDISTNGKIVPSIMCNETKPITLNSASISTSSLSCQYRKSLHRIKIHTSNEIWAGTDSTILLDLKVMEKKTNKLLGECKDLLIDNYGDDRERSQIDYYFSGDYGNYNS